MTDTLKDEFDPAVENLNRGARENLPYLCAEFMGKAKFGNIGVNAKALRIAAENRSYEAFERMLEMSSENAIGVTTLLSIGLGEDWNTVKEIAKTDERIAAALRKSDETVEANIDEFFAGLDDADEPPPAPAQRSGWKWPSWLSFR